MGLDDEESGVHERPEVRDELRRLDPIRLNEIRPRSIRLNEIRPRSIRLNEIRPRSIRLNEIPADPIGLDEMRRRTPPGLPA